MVVSRRPAPQSALALPSLGAQSGPLDTFIYQQSFQNAPVTAVNFGSLSEPFGTFIDTKKTRERKEDSEAAVREFHELQRQAAGNRKKLRELAAAHVIREGLSPAYRQVLEQMVSDNSLDAYGMQLNEKLKVAANVSGSSPDRTGDNYIEPASETFARVAMETWREMFGNDPFLNTPWGGPMMLAGKTAVERRAFASFVEMRAQSVEAVGREAFKTRIGNYATVLASTPTREVALDIQSRMAADIAVFEEGSIRGKQYALDAIRQVMISYPDRANARLALQYLEMVPFGAANETLGSSPEGRAMFFQLQKHLDSAEEHELAREKTMFELEQARVSREVFHAFGAKLQDEFQKTGMTTATEKEIDSYVQSMPPESSSRYAAMQAAQSLIASLHASRNQANTNATYSALGAIGSAASVEDAEAVLTAVQNGAYGELTIDQRNKVYEAVAAVRSGAESLRRIELDHTRRVSMDSLASSLGSYGVIGASAAELLADLESKFKDIERRAREHAAAGRLGAAAGEEGVRLEEQLRAEANGLLEAQKKIAEQRGKDDMALRADLKRRAAAGEILSEGDVEAAARILHESDFVALLSSIERNDWLSRVRINETIRMAADLIDMRLSSEVGTQDQLRRLQGATRFDSRELAKKAVQVMKERRRASVDASDQQKELDAAIEIVLFSERQTMLDSELKARQEVAVDPERALLKGTSVASLSEVPAELIEAVKTMPVRAVVTDERLGGEPAAIRLDIPSMRKQDLEYLRSGQEPTSQQMERAIVYAAKKKAAGDEDWSAGPADKKAIDLETVARRRAAAVAFDDDLKKAAFYRQFPLDVSDSSARERHVAGLKEQIAEYDKLTWGKQTISKLRERRLLERLSDRISSGVPGRRDPSKYDSIRHGVRDIRWFVDRDFMLRLLSRVGVDESEIRSGATTYLSRSPVSIGKNGELLNPYTTLIRPDEVVVPLEKDLLVNTALVDARTASFWETARSDLRSGVTNSVHVNAARRIADIAGAKDVNTFVDAQYHLAREIWNPQILASR